MRRRKAPEKRWTLPQRLGMAFVGLMIALLGIGTLMRGHLHYHNYWRGAVFAPFALLVGLLAIFVAIVQGRQG